MENQWDFERCLAVLNRELSLLSRIYTVQTAVKEAVFSREWADFDWKIAEVKQMGVEISDLDLERAGLFAALAASLFGAQAEAPSFYALVSRLPEDERREISRLYRLIKMETLKMQAFNQSFFAYLSEAKMAATACLEAAFPDRGGSLYTREGAKQGQNLKSVVFNRHI